MKDYFIDMPVIQQSIVCYDEEPTIQETGILDKNGNMIVYIERKRPIGFIDFGE